MAEKTEQRVSLLLNYFVAFSVGISLSIAMLFIVWDDVLSKYSGRLFNTEILKIKDNVKKNISSSHEAISILSSFKDSSPAFYDQQFRDISQKILDMQSHVSAIMFIPLFRTDQGYILPVLHQINREAPLILHGYDINGDGKYSDVLRNIFGNKNSSPIFSVIQLNSKSYYVLFQVVLNESYQSISDADPISSIKGIVSIIIDPNKLFGQFPPNKNLVFEPYTDSSNFRRRQHVFSYADETQDSNQWIIKKQSANYLIRFDSFSIKLFADNNIYWSDIDKKLIYTVFFIGIGITLLLIALVRAKDMQTRELGERNKIIEDQVKQQTKELALVRDKALDASREKSDFLSNMSHEIRTPLTAIVGMAELLTDTSLTAKQAKYVEVFNRAANSLMNLVNNILDLSKIEAGQLVIENTKFNLFEIIKETADIFEIQANNKNINLRIEKDEEMNFIRNGDPNRIKQIMLNLLGNAIKFTDRGEIIISITTNKEDENQCIISVKDTGIGISELQQNEIFSRFTQADSSTTRKYGGTGLGLAVCKRLLDNIDGKITVESKEGSGSTFSCTIKIPVDKSGQFIDSELKETQLEQSINQRTFDEKSLQKKNDAMEKRILLVEDTEDNRFLIKVYLGKIYVLDEAENGELAIDMFKQRHYDLVLMDIEMPVMDGYETTKKIRLWEKENNKAPVPIIALTAHIVKEEIEKFISIGCNTHLGKPINKNKLLTTLENYLF